MKRVVPPYSTTLNENGSSRLRHTKNEPSCDTYTLVSHPSSLFGLPFREKKISYPLLYPDERYPCLYWFTPTPPMGSNVIVDLLEFQIRSDEMKGQDLFPFSCLSRSVEFVNHCSTWI